MARPSAESRTISLDAASGLFDRIRSRCAEVTKRAQHVRIDDAGLEAFALRLASDQWSADDLDPAHYFSGDESETLAFVVSLDAINFGSGWFPALHKRPGMSGYRTIATACRERFEVQGSFGGEALRATTPESMAEVLGQDLRHGEVAELMGLYAQAWRDLGVWLGGRYYGILPAHLAGDFHFAVAEQAFGFDCGTCRKLIVFEKSPIRIVHGIEVVKIGQVDFDLDHIIAG